MLTLFYLLLNQVICAEQCTFKSNLISIDYECTIDDIKDPYRPTMIRLTSPGCPYSPASQAQWEKAASLYPQVNFVTVNSWENTKITSLFGKSLMTPYHGLFLANSSKLIEDSTFGLVNGLNSSPQKFLDIISQKTKLYQIAPPLVSLSPMIIDSFYTAIDNPIILLYNSKCTDQVPFLNEWSRVANEVIFSNGVNPRIGMLDCSIYADECLRWSHPYSVKTPRALIYSSKTGNYEVLDTYGNITPEKIDGLYANALSRTPQATPSPVPIPEVDNSIPSQEGYELIENEGLKSRTVDDIRTNYKSNYIKPDCACKTPSECESQTLDVPSQCPEILPSDDDHTNSLKLINFFRTLAGLKTTVTENTEWSTECYKTAINMHKIGKVPPDHIIPEKDAIPEWCGEANNIAVSKDSLLSENSNSVFASSIGLFKDEGTHNNLIVGHRRYLLHPNLNTIGIGFYPYKEDYFPATETSVAYRLMKPAVTVIRITKDNSLPYIENSIPEDLKFISWPSEGPFPLEHLPSNWHISHTDFRTTKLEDLRIFVRRDDGAILEVKQASIVPKNSVNGDALVIQMTEEALKRCQLMRTITVTVFNDVKKKVYRFSFELFSDKETTEICLYSTDASKCPSSITDNNNKLGPNSYQSSVFSQSTNPVKVHVVEEIKLGETKLSFTANQKFFLVGEPIDGTVVIGSQTQVDVQNPSKTSYEINWDVKGKTIGKLETASTAKSVDIIIQNEDEKISIYDVTFYTGRQTRFGLSKSIFTGEDNDIYFTIGGSNDNFFVMASTSPAYVEFSCQGDSEVDDSNAIKLDDYYDMIKQTTNKRVVKFYISGVTDKKPIDLRCFIPGRKRDYQFIVTGGVIHMDCDMNISNVANSITFSKYREESADYTFQVNVPKFNLGDTRYICPMDYITINGAMFTGNSAGTAIFPYIKGDQNAINANDPSNFFNLFPKEGTEDTSVIDVSVKTNIKTRCIITTSGKHSSYIAEYDSDHKYNPFVFRPAKGTEDKQVTLTLLEPYTNSKEPQSNNFGKIFFENYQDLILVMPTIKEYRSKLQNFLGVYYFDNCGKVTFIGNDDTTPKEPYEIDGPLVLGNFNYGCILVSPTVLVTGSSTYDGSWVHAKNMSVSVKLNPTINNITVKEGIEIDSSTVILEGCSLLDNIFLNIKKTEGWWPSISLQKTKFVPNKVTIDLGIVSSASHLLDSSEEYESHILINGINSSLGSLSCEEIKGKTTIVNNGKFSLECSADKTELVVVKGKENAPILTPDDGENPPQNPSNDPENPPQNPSNDPENPPQNPSNDPENPPQNPSGGVDPTNIITLEPTPEPAPEENQTKLDLGSQNDLTAEEVNKKLTDKFNEMPDDGTIKNVVVITNADKVPFNTELKPNQFIKPPENSEIEFKGGNLNLVLPDKVNVVLSQPENPKLLLKGSGSVEIKIEDGKEKPESITLNTKNEINGTVTITVPDTVKSFTIDSLDLSSTSQIGVKKNDQNKGDVEVTVNDITTKTGTTATLNDMTIGKSLKIVQSAVLNVENVDVKSATITYDINDFNTLSDNKPFFTGKFNSIPNSFTLSKSDSKNPAENKEYTVVSGEFENTKCEDWYPKIHLEKSGFNTRECKDVVDKTLESEKKRIVIKNDPSKSGGNGGGGGLGPGPIAGIVIGVVAAIAIVVVVVIVVIKKKKNKLNSSSVEDGGNAQKDDEV